MFAQRGKTGGGARAMENRRSRDPGETWIILHAKTVVRKAAMLVTVSAPLIPSLKRMRRHLLI